MAITLTEAQRQVIAAHLRFSRELGIYDFYRRPEDAAVMAAFAAGVESGVEIPRAASEHSEAAAEIRQPASAVNISGEEIPIVRKPVSVIESLASQPFEGTDKAAALHALQQEIGLCMRCPLAMLGRHTVVFADGNPNAELMFVGEGPGADEDAQGLPFVGRAGQLLNNMIVAMGLRRADVYVANIVKCRPPQNRAPEPVEANTCLPFLMRQFDIVQPKVVVALGSTAATYLMGLKVSLSSLRGRMHEFRGSKLLVTYHPAYLLRDPRQKKETWADLQIAMQFLGLKGAAAVSEAGTMAEAEAN